MPDRWCLFNYKKDLIVMRKNNIDTSENMIPDCFLQLTESGLIDEGNTEKTDDGFFCLNKSISALLSERGIHTFPAGDGTELKCENYYDDWYIYALRDENSFVYGLFKLREQEYDMYAGERADYDSPGVTVSFIAYGVNTLMKCLAEPTEDNRAAMSEEINRVVARRGQKHNSAIKRYFCRTESKAAYLIAELYIRHILSFTHKGFIIVPQKYEEIYSASLIHSDDSKEKRLPDFINRNNEAAGRIVCDHDKIYINNPQAPDRFEKLAILATHTADTSFNSFACEVQYHAMFLSGPVKIRIPFLGSIYESAVRADLSIDDSEFEGNAPYHRADSKLVKKHIDIHGEF